MKRPRIFTMSNILLIVVLISMISTIILSFSDNDTYHLDSNKDSPISDELQITNIPKTSGDGITSYDYNKFTFKDTQFNTNNDFEDWIGTDGTGSTIDVDSGDCMFEVTSDPGDFDDHPRIVYEPSPFLKGEMIINWFRDSLDSGDYFEIRYTTGTDWSTANVLIQCPYTSADISTIPLNDASHGTNNANFKIAVILNSDRDGIGDFGDNGYIDYIQLNTWEFIVTEEISDPIPQQTSQQITAYIFSEKAGRSDTDTRIQYKCNDIGDDDLSSGTSTIAYTGFTGNEFSFDISNTIYDYGDIFYYRIFTSGNDGISWSATSDVYEFDFTDTTNPAFANGENSSIPEYDKNLEYTIDCSEIAGDSGINSIDMYVKNGSAATISDFNIISNEQASLPIESGTFHFNIPHTVLDFYQTLHILIRAYDVSGRSQDFTDSINVYDYVKPTYQFISINETNPKIGEAVKITYNIEEPNDASGFATDLTNIKLRYNNISQPSNINDYTGEISSENTSIPITGGKIEFIIPNTNHFYGDQVFYFLYFADNAQNYENSLPDVTSFQIKGINANFILPIEASGNTNYYYNTPNINISFTASEECDLWYKVDNGAPSTPIFGTNLNKLLVLSEGAHTITVYCGYEANKKIYNLFIDTTPTSEVEATINKNGNNIQITWAQPDGYDDLTYYEIWKKDKNSDEFVLVADHVTQLFYYIDGLPTGSYEFKITSVDRAGNRSEFTTPIKISISIPFYIYILIIGAVIGSIVAIIKIKGNVELNQKRSELSDIDLEFDVEDSYVVKFEKKKEDTDSSKTIGMNGQLGRRSKESEKTEWKDLSWNSKTKSQGEYDLQIKQVEKGYWNNRLRISMETGIKLELDGNITHAIRNYQIALRCAEVFPGTDKNLIEFLRNKLKSIGTNPLSYLD